MKKQFKAESKKILDMMINSIYTNKEIFLRELISNASDAIDKLYYRSLTDKDIKIKKDDLAIWINLSQEDKTIMISDNGCGMSKTELEENLGTIAKSGSELFKEQNDVKEDISIIGQFGVGFYSAFMVANKVVVKSKTVDSDEAYLWESSGMDGYTINKCDKATVGTEIILYLKDEVVEEIDLLSTDKIRSIIKKYSDYIRYPIKMMVKHDDHEDEEIINSMVPIWKKKKSEVKDEEFNDFYSDKFYDYQEPLKVIRSDVEGLTSYSTLLFIPSHAPYNYYTKEYEKGLELYSRGVLIMDKCSDLLPDCFSFVKGIVDSEDIQLNISRETMQQNNQVKLISKNIEKKIKSELLDMLKNDREKYEKFYQAFGMQLKHGIYSSYGLNKEMLEDLLLFYSSKDEKHVTLDEYVSRMDVDDKEIYYASGESINNIKMIPQVELMNDKDKEILYLTEYLDEFVIKTLGEYKDKKFVNVTNNNLDNLTNEEKEKIEKVNNDNKVLLDIMKECLKEQVKDIKFTNSLKNHPVCLTTQGEVSLEMEKILNQMGQDQDTIKAETTLEINNNHAVSEKIRKLHEDNNQEELAKYTKILYNSARLVAGLPVENPSELTDLICEIMGR